MKRKIERKAVTVAIVFFISTIANADITDVNIVPIIPTNVDQISIITYGVEGNMGVDITSTDFIQNGFLLELDIYLDLGITPVETPWSHTENIGTLPAGFYELTVNRYLPSYYPPPIIDSYVTDFEVVPEPTTFFLFGLGLLIVRPVSRRKRRGLIV